MTNYQVIENAVGCIKSVCDEIAARDVDPSEVLIALKDATKDKTPLEYDLSEVRKAADALDEKHDFLSDVAKDIRRSCSTVNIRQEHLRNERKEIYNIINDIVGANLSEKITDALLAGGVCLEKDV